MSNNGIAGVEMFDTRLVPLPSKEKVSISKIFQLNNFLFIPHGFTTHRAFNVGNGKVFSWKSTHPLKAISALLFQDSKLSEKSISFTTPKSAVVEEKEKEKDEDEKLSAKITSVKRKEGVSDEIYECTQEGCIARFVNHKNFLHHICRGKHTLLPERRCLTDTAALLYKARLETIENKEMCSLMLEIDRTKAVYNGNNKFPSLPQGWALPLDRKNVRLSEKQKKYLTDRFDEGARKENPVRWKPEAVAEHMSEYKVRGKFYFSTDEFLKVTQIRSFFRRLKAKGNNRPESEELSENEDEEAYEEQVAEEAEELLENVRKALRAEEELEDTNATVSFKKCVTTPNLNQPKRASFRDKK